MSGFAIPAVRSCALCPFRCGIATREGERLIEAPQRDTDRHRRPPAIPYLRDHTISWLPRNQFRRHPNAPAQVPTASKFPTRPRRRLPARWREVVIPRGVSPLRRHDLRGSGGSREGEVCGCDRGLCDEDPEVGAVDSLLATGAQTAQEGTPQGEEGRASDTGHGTKAGQEDAARGAPFDLAEAKAEVAVVNASVALS